MCAAAGAISRARATARAHQERAADVFELGELHGGQLCVLHNLTRGWPHDSSAVQEARRDACGYGRDQLS